MKRFEARQENDQKYMVFTDSSVVMLPIQSDRPNIEFYCRFTREGGTLAVQLGPRQKGVEGSEVFDEWAKQAAGNRD